jgi:Tol biopolymer transport system component
MNADGTDQTNVSHNDLTEGGPTWSPDGKRIAFASVPDEYSTSQIYVMDADGSNRVKISGDHPRDMSDPAWSPDGKRVAFYSHDGGDAIYVMNVDGTNVVKFIMPPGNEATSEGGLK